MATFLEVVGSIAVGAVGAVAIAHFHPTVRKTSKECLSLASEALKKAREAKKAKPSEAISLVEVAPEVN